MNKKIPLYEKFWQNYAKYSGRIMLLEFKEIEILNILKSWVNFKPNLSRKRSTSSKYSRRYIIFPAS